MVVELLKNCPHRIEIGDSYASASGRLVELRLFGVFGMKISQNFDCYLRHFWTRICVVLGKTPRELIVTDFFF